MARETFFRLCTRAPRMKIESFKGEFLSSIIENQLAQTSGPRGAPSPGPRAETDHGRRSREAHPPPFARMESALQASLALARNARSVPHLDFGNHVATNACSGGDSLLPPLLGTLSGG